ncbi:MAG TPA: TasA family protein [Candidatus Atribacteria bacterium]|nr:TasA family protein [Candidatus Atribacteria bacterium]HPT77947.1 TasA family protein [Candidatus Atribacteria bacterium]
MRRKVFISLLYIMTALAMVIGWTFAWFTDSEEVADAKFQAGTVDVKVIDKCDYINENWNPGDCSEVEFKFKNDGTKRIFIRFLPDLAWYQKENGKLVKSGLPANNVTIQLMDGDDTTGNGYDPAHWQMEDNIIYYIGDPIKPGEIVVLKLKVCLAGKETGNEYQGLVFKLGGTVEAVQASNGAPNSEWGVDFYDLIKND